MNISLVIAEKHQFQRISANFGEKKTLIIGSSQFGFPQKKWQFYDWNRLEMF